MYRVTEAEVREIIDVSASLAFNAFIVVANLMVTKHLVGTGLTDPELKEIERWLSAHFVAVREPRVRQRSIGDARETYAISGGYSGGLDATPYGQQVMLLDWTGVLSSTLGKKAVILDAVEENYE